MILVKNIGKDYRDNGAVTQALKNISFEIKPGEFVAIMGPSGSGKSTLLHILSFMDRPTSGLYAFSGQNTDKLTDADLAHLRNQEMGFVFQAFNLLARSSVYDNVEMPLVYSRTPVAARKSRVEKAAAAVELSDKLYVAAGRLSGGQKQRVAIARALVNNPNIIFADEPTGNLDSRSGENVMKILKDLNKSGKTIVLVTHETYTAQCAQRLIRLKDGEIELDEPIKNQTETFFK